MGNEDGRGGDASLPVESVGQGDVECQVDAQGPDAKAKEGEGQDGYGQGQEGGKEAVAGHFEAGLASIEDAENGDDASRCRIRQAQHIR